MTEEKSKRASILEAAAVVFAKHGFHNAKVEEIASEAGVGKGTVYEYFTSKQQLFQELYIHGTEQLLQEIVEETAKCLDASSKLRKIALLHCHHILHSRDLTRITMDGYGQLDRNFRQCMFQHQVHKVALIKQIIEEGLKAGEFRSDLSSRTAALAYSGAMGTIFHLAVFEEQIDESSLTAQVVDIVEVIFQGILA